jgi:hypothetical protein
VKDLHMEHDMNPISVDPPGGKIARRRYLIDPRRQLRAAFMTTSVVVALVVLVNLGFALLRSSQSSFLAAVAPQLSPLLEEQNTAFFLLMIVLSVALVVAVLLKTIVETHRTAGAVFAVGQRLDRVRRGDYRVALKLRRNDNLQNLEPLFNTMVAALRDRELTEAQTLERLAADAESAGTVCRTVGEELRRIATRKRELGSGT